LCGYSAALNIGSVSVAYELTICPTHLHICTCHQTFGMRRIEAAFNLQALHHQVVKCLPFTEERIVNNRRVAQVD
jgi:hypothetical protein